MNGTFTPPRLDELDSEPSRYDFRPPRTDELDEVQRPLKIERVGEHTLAVPLPKEPEMAPRSDREIAEAQEMNRLQGRGLWEQINTPFTQSFGTSIHELRQKLPAPIQAVTSPFGPTKYAFGKETTPRKITEGLEAATDDLTDSLLTPLGVLTLGVGALPKLAQRLISAVFATHMASQLPEQAKQVKAAIDAGDVKEATRAIAGTIGSGVFTGLAAKHALTRGKPGLSPEEVQANKYAEDFWRGVEEEKATPVDLLRTQLDTPIVPTPTGRNRIRVNLKPKEENADAQRSREENLVPEYQGVPSRDNIQADETQVREVNSQPTGSSSGVQPATPVEVAKSGQEEILTIKSGDVAPVEFDSMFGPQPYFRLTKPIIAPDSGNVMAVGEKITKAVLDKYGFTIPYTEIEKIPKGEPKEIALTPVPEVVESPNDIARTIPTTERSGLSEGSKEQVGANKQVNVSGRGAMLVPDSGLSGEIVRGAAEVERSALPRESGTQEFGSSVITEQINKRDKREWSKLPASFEQDAVRAAFQEIKGLLPKKAISERVRASKALTFQELREAVTAAVKKTASVPEEPVQKFRIGTNPSTYSLVERMAQSESEKSNNEQPVRLKNDRTGEESVVLEQDLTPVKTRTTEEKAPKRDLDDELRAAKLDPSVFQNNAQKREALKRAKALSEKSIGDGEVRPIREGEAEGTAAVGDLIGMSNLDTRTIQTAQALLDSPMMRDPFWNDLRVELQQTLLGGAKGARLGKLIQLASTATPDTFPHEVAHILYDWLPENTKSAINKARVEALKEKFPDAPQEVVEGRLGSDAYLQQSLPLEMYQYSSPTEFMAHFFGDRFARETFAKRNQGFWKELGGKIQGMVRALLDAFQRFRGKDPDMDRVYREMRDGTWIPKPESGSKAQARQLSIESAVKNLEQKESEIPGSGVENVRLEEAAQPVAQLEKVQKAVNELRAITATPLSRDAAPALKARQEVARRVLSNPWIKSQFVKPVMDVELAAKALEQSADTYGSLKADPSISPEMKSAAAGKASKDIDAFYRAKEKFDGRYENKLDALKKDLMETLEDSVQSSYKAKVLKILQDDFLTLGKEVVRQSNDAQALTSYRRMLGQREAVRNVLQWASKNLDMASLDKVTVDNLVDAMDAKKAEGKSLEQTAGASSEIIRDVARFISMSEPLRNSLAEGKQFLETVRGSVPFDKWKNALAEAIKKENYEGAISLFAKGVGKTEVERAEAVKTANFMARRERRLLSSIEALKQSKELMDSVEASPEFRSLATEIYGDAGVREVIRGNTGNQYILEPVYDEPPTVLSYDSSQIAAESNLMKLKDYADRALQYVTETDAPGYDPKKSAGLKEFISQRAWFTNPSIMPAAGRLLPSFMRFIPRKIFELVGAPEQIPNKELAYAAGLPAELASRSLNAYSTAKEVAMGIFTTYSPKLDAALSKATKEHKLTPEQYHELILNPLSASRQYFGNTGRLEVGSPIGNGYTITPADMAYFRTLREFNREMISKLTGTAKQNYEVIKNNPAGILVVDNGKLTMRMPFETGPDTVSRHFGMVRDWASRWTDMTPEQRGEFVNENLNRLLFGYVADAGQPSFNFRYAFEAPFKEILAEAKAGNPIGSLEDLVTRTKEKLDEIEGAPVLTEPQVREVILGEIGRILERISRFDEQGLKSSKIKISGYGGENSFNTERGGQVMPSGWYDYGSVTTGQHLTYLNSALTKFAIEHTYAVEALQQSLHETIRQFERRLTQEPGVRKASVKERQAGKDFYSWNEALVTLKRVTEYLNKLKASMNYEKRAKAVESGNMLGLQTPLDIVTASLLSGPGPNIMNSYGGGLNVVMTDMMLRNQSLLAAGIKNAAKAVARMYKEGVNLIAHEGNPLGRAVYSTLRKAEKIPLLGKIPEHFADVADSMRELYGDSRRDALVLNKQLKETLGSMWDWREMGGLVNSKPDPRLVVRLVRQAETLGRMGARSLGQATVGNVDSRINVTSKRMSEELQQDLENRARKYGALREQAAKAEGYDPYDSADPRNQFSPQELGGGRIPRFGLDEFAIRLRDTMRRESDVNIDERMMDFHRRYKEAEAREIEQKLEPGELTKDVHLLDDAQLRQLRLALATEINLSTFASRPIISRTGLLPQRLSLFLGFPSFQMHKMADQFARSSKKSYIRGNIAALPHGIKGMTAAAIIGSLAIGTAEYFRRLLMNKYSNSPTIFEAGASGSPSQVANALIGGYAAMSPFYGSAVNSARGTAYKTGFDLNSQFVAVNLASDAAKVLREAYQTGDIGDPMLKFSQRWLFPMNYVAPLTPQIQGLQEVSNARNLMSKGAQGTDMETALRKPGSGSFQYSPVTPILNDAMSAIGRGDTAGFNEAWTKLVQFETESGKKNPEQSALQALNARNPVTQVFGSKPTEEQLSKVLSNLPPDQASQVSAMLQRYGSAVASVGGNETVTRIRPETGAPSRSRTSRKRLRVSRGSTRRRGIGRIRGIRAPRLRLSRQRFRGTRNRVRRRGLTPAYR